MTWLRVGMASVALVVAAGCGGGSGSAGDGSVSGRVPLAKECPQVKKAIAKSDSIPSPRQADEIAEYTELEQTLADIAARLSVGDAQTVTDLQAAASDRLDVLNYSGTSADDSVKSIKAFQSAQAAVEAACAKAGAPIS